MKRLVIIPTYNEKENISALLTRIPTLGIENLDMLIVDDNSPDGTANIVKSLQKENPNIHIMVREKKSGLGTAYIAGFNWALEKGYDYIAQMDADFSHNPKDLPKLFKAAEKYDWVIGSRYINGVSVVYWPMSRLILSYGANIYSRIITGMPVMDGTAGFKCWKREVLSNINLEKVKSQGYSFQIEMNFRAWKKGYKFFEVPIIFIDRTEGQSKMSKKIVREAVWMVWQLKLWSILGKV
ncbi:MAG: polyprenol monophosphomannose synthase, partial [Candidatus Marinimicrobia bacterium]|nr:polyprenol monophosphomannose synthase [Candidatus Neomarinimicrobiota bacterium]